VGPEIGGGAGLALDDEAAVPVGQRGALAEGGECGAHSGEDLFAGVAHGREGSFGQDTEITERGRRSQR
jgi:hypothetical protein